MVTRGRMSRWMCCVCVVVLFAMHVAGIPLRRKTEHSRKFLLRTPLLSDLRPQLYRKWTERFSEDMWPEELSGDGPTEAFTSVWMLSKSSAVPKGESRLHSPSPADVASDQVEPFPTVIDTEIDSSEMYDSDDVFSHSSLEYEGPSSLLNTFIFRPSFTSGVYPVRSTPSPESFSVVKSEDLSASWDMEYLITSLKSVSSLPRQAVSSTSSDSSFHKEISLDTLYIQPSNSYVSEKSQLVSGKSTTFYESDHTDVSNGFGDSNIYLSSSMQETYITHIFDPSDGLNGLSTIVSGTSPLHQSVSMTERLYQSTPTMQTLTVDPSPNGILSSPSSSSPQDIYAAENTDKSQNHTLTSTLSEYAHASVDSDNLQVYPSSYKFHEIVSSQHSHSNAISANVEDMWTTMTSSEFALQSLSESHLMDSNGLQTFTTEAYKSVPIILISEANVFSQSERILMTSSHKDIISQYESPSPQDSDILHNVYSSSSQPNIPMSTKLPDYLSHISPSRTDISTSLGYYISSNADEDYIYSTSSETSDADVISKPITTPHEFISNELHTDFIPNSYFDVSVNSLIDISYQEVSPQSSVSDSVSYNFSYELISSFYSSRTQTKITESVSEDYLDKSVHLYFSTDTNSIMIKSFSENLDFNQISTHVSPVVPFATIMPNFVTSVLGISGDDRIPDDYSKAGSFWSDREDVSNDNIFYNTFTSENNLRPESDFEVETSEIKIHSENAFLESYAPIASHSHSMGPRRYVSNTLEVSDIWLEASMSYDEAESRTIGYVSDLVQNVIEGSYSQNSANDFSRDDSTEQYFETSSWKTSNVNFETKDWLQTDSIVILPSFSHVDLNSDAVYSLSESNQEFHSSSARMLSQVEFTPSENDDLDSKLNASSTEYNVSFTHHVTVRSISESYDYQISESKEASHLTTEYLVIPITSYAKNSSFSPTNGPVSTYSSPSATEYVNVSSSQFAPNSERSGHLSSNYSGLIATNIHSVHDDDTKGDNFISITNDVPIVFTSLPEVAPVQSSVFFSELNSMVDQTWSLNSLIGEISDLHTITPEFLLSSEFKRSPLLSTYSLDLSSMNSLKIEDDTSESPNTVFYDQSSLSGFMGETIITLVQPVTNNEGTKFSGSILPLVSKTYSGFHSASSSVLSFATSTDYLLSSSCDPSCNGISISPVEEYGDQLTVTEVNYEGASHVPATSLIFNTENTAFTAIISPTFYVEEIWNDTSHSEAHSSIFEAKTSSAVRTRILTQDTEYDDTGQITKSLTKTFSELTLGDKLTSLSMLTTSIIDQAYEISNSQPSGAHSIMKTLQAQTKTPNMTDRFRTMEDMITESTTTVDFLPSWSATASPGSDQEIDTVVNSTSISESKRSSSQLRDSNQTLQSKGEKLSPLLSNPLNDTESNVFTKLLKSSSLQSEFEFTSQTLDVRFSRNIESFELLSSDIDISSKVSDYSDTNGVYYSTMDLGASLMPTIIYSDLISPFKSFSLESTLISRDFYTDWDINEASVSNTPTYQFAMLEHTASATVTKLLPEQDESNVEISDKWFKSQNISALFSSIDDKSRENASYFMKHTDQLMTDKPTSQTSHKLTSFVSEVTPHDPKQYSTQSSRHEQIIESFSGIAISRITPSARSSHFTSMKVYPSSEPKSIESDVVFHRPSTPVFLHSSWSHSTVSSSDQISSSSVQITKPSDPKSIESDIPIHKVTTFKLTGYVISPETSSEFQISATTTSKTHTALIETAMSSLYPHEDLRTSTDFGADYELYSLLAVSSLIGAGNTSKTDPNTTIGTTPNTWPNSSTNGSPTPTRNTILFKDNHYWVLTVLEAPVRGELPENFSHTMEIRLANAYSEAFRTRTPMGDKKSPSDLIIVKILSLTNDRLLRQLEIIYLVERGGELVSASIASEYLNFLRYEQLREYLGHHVIVKARPYRLDKSNGKSNNGAAIPVLLIVCVIFGSLLLICCCFCIYCKCCRPRPVPGTPVSSVSGSLQRSLSTYGQHNKKQLFQELSHKLSTEMSSHLKDGSGLSEGYLDTHPRKSHFPGKKPSRLPSGKDNEESDAESRLLRRILANRDVTTSPLPVKIRKSSAKDTKSTTSEASIQEKQTKPKKRKKARLIQEFPDVTTPEISSDRGLTNDQLHVLPRPASRRSHPSSKTKDATSRHSPHTNLSSSSEKTLETESEGSNAELLPPSARHVLDDQDDTETTETQLHLSRVRQRISELLDDAFAMAGSNRLYGSLRSKKIEPTTDLFPGFASFRKSRSHSAAARHYTLMQHDERHRRPISEGGQRLVGAITDDGQLTIRPPPKLVWAPSPELSQIEIERPLQNPVETRNRNVVYPLLPSATTITPASSLPLLDTLHESASQMNLPLSMRCMLREAASEMYLAHSSRMNSAVRDQYDEIDVISALREGEPVAALIQAIKDELQKFSSTLPGSNDNESTA